MGSAQEEHEITAVLGDEHFILENSKLGAKAHIKARPTVREQLRYQAALGFGRDLDLYERYYRAALPLVDTWECEAYPDLQVINLDESTDKKLVDLIIWLGMGVFLHIENLERIPPN